MKKWDIYVYGDVNIDAIIKISTTNITLSTTDVIRARFGSFSIKGALIIPMSSLTESFDSNASLKKVYTI